MFKTLSLSLKPYSAELNLKYLSLLEYQVGDDEIWFYFSDDSKTLPCLKLL